MRLLVVTQAVDQDDPALGFFVQWVQAFATRVERLLVVCQRTGSSPVSFPSHTTVHSLGKERGLPKILQLLRFYSFIIRKRREYDVVFVHMNPEYVVYAGLLWRLMDKHVSLWYTHKHVGWKLRYAETLAHRIFTASEESFRIPSKKVQVVGHGIDTEHFRPSFPPRVFAEGELVLLSVGRITPIKRHDIAIDVIAALHRRGVPARLSLVGDSVLPGDEIHRQALLHQAQELGVIDRFRILALPHARMPELFSRADILLHPSETGSLDKVLLEAMAAGVFPVSSSVGSRSVLPKPLVVPHQTVASFMDTVTALCAMPDTERIALRDKNRAIVVAHHNLSHLVDTMIETLSKPHVTG